MSIRDIADKWRSNVKQDEIGIAVYAHDVKRVYEATAYLRFDRNLLEYSGYSEGDFLKAGGALVDFRISHTPNTGQVRFTASRPSTLPPTDGSGEVIIFYLKRLAGFRPPSTASLQWDLPGLDQGGCFIGREDCSYFIVNWHGATVEVFER